MEHKNKLKEIIKKVKEVEIIANRVSSVFSGEYRSLFHGQGMEFDQVRLYSLGDDVRTIDWNVSARTKKLHVKTFQEERENMLFFLCDVSASLDYASADNVVKRDVMAQIVAVLAFSAIKNNDKVGLLLFDDEVRSFIPSKRGYAHVLSMIEKLILTETKAKKTSLKEAFSFLNKVQKRRAQIFILSDMILEDNYKKEIFMALKQHSVNVISIKDAFEKNLSNVGLVHLRDSETGEEILINTASSHLRERYKKALESKEKKLKRELASLGVGYIDVLNTPDFISKFARQFWRLQKRY